VVRRLLLLLLTLAILASTLTDLAAAEPIEGTGAQLPTGRFGGSASWDGHFAYYAGGQGCGNGNSLCNEIVRFDPMTRTATVMQAHLPTPRKGTVSFSDQRYHYIIGGYDGKELGQILRYDGTRDVIEVMNAVLPSPSSYGSIAWNGQYAYIIGGFSAEGRIFRYNPLTDSITQSSLNLPTPRHYSSAVWMGQSLYVFGGQSGETDLADIVRLTPATGTVETSAATLPTARYGTGAVTDGTMAYIVGGESGGCTGGACSRPTEILKYDPATDHLVTLQARLPDARVYPGAVGDSKGMFILGGLGCPTGYCNTILAFNDPAAVTTPIPKPWAFLGGFTFSLPLTGAIVVLGVTAALVARRRRSARSTPLMAQAPQPSGISPEMKGLNLMEKSAWFFLSKVGAKLSDADLAGLIGTSAKKAQEHRSKLQKELLEIAQRSDPHAVGKGRTHHRDPPVFYYERPDRASVYWLSPLGVQAARSLLGTRAPSESKRDA
jgi:hypothetical protein